MSSKKQNKFVKFLKEIYTQSITKNGKIHPPYIYVMLLLTFVVVVNVLKVFKYPELISDTYALGLCGFVVAWAKLIQAKDKKNEENNGNSE